MELDRKQRVLSRAHGRCPVSDLRGMITQVACRSSHRLVVHPIFLRREPELPPGDSARNQVLPLSPWYHAIGVDPLTSGFLLGHLLVLVGMVMIAAVAAIMTFDRRDLGV